MLSHSECCRCNRTGSCKGCACVKAGKPCSNCLPSKLGSCANRSSMRSCVQQPSNPSNLSTPINAPPATGQPVTSAATAVSADYATISIKTAPETPSSSTNSQPNTDAQQLSTVPTPINAPPATGPTVDAISAVSPTTTPVITASEISSSSTDSQPAFFPTSSTHFRWGDVTSKTFCEDIGKAYEEQTLWRKNTFSPPSGHAGTEFVKEHTRLLRAYKDRTPMECVAMEAVMVMPSLLLQKPHAKAGSKEFSRHLTRRLSLWKAGNINELLEEARTIQSRLTELDRQRGKTTSKLNRHFAALIRKGEVHSAISLITEHGKGGVLELTPEVRAALRTKHPQAKPAIPDVLLQVPAVNPILFESLTGDVVRKTALATQGAAGPSMGDAYVWRRMMTSFKSASKDLCDAVAEVARHLASQHVDPAGLMPLLNNRLIPLDKNPGVRPIGIGEVLRRIIGKSLMTVLKSDITRAAGVSQVCAGHPSGCEAAIHALRKVFASMSTDAVLLVDADNAFNRLNRAVALHNIRYTCPPLATILTNIYRAPSRLFVTGGMVLSSEEGTTQGCPLSMAMYALSAVPLINKCQSVLSTDDLPRAMQVWYADDAAAGGDLKPLRKFWDILVQHGPAYGYFPKPSKTFLVVKTECRAAATEEFEGTGVQITEDGDDLAHKAGQHHLGAAVGSPEFVAAYLDENVATWVEQVTHLADIATTQPHAAYAGFVFGLQHRWTFIQRTMPTAGDHMQPLKDEIDHKLLPTLVKHESND